MKKVVFGLGNYGKLYDNTRHNIGFDLLKKIAEYSFKGNEESFAFKNENNWEIISKENKNGEVFFVKLKGFINNSGILIRKFMKIFNLKIKNIMIIHDDVSMDFGKLRLKKESSSGGHNGVKSVIEELKSESFYRIKIGVGMKNSEDLKKWVLGKFEKEEISKMDEISWKVANILAKWIEEKV